MDLKISFVLVTATFILSTATNAATITHGELTTNDDGSTNLITDSLNNYEWLRFDVLANLTYAETLSVLDSQDGGGWSIAGTEQAHLFVDALFSPVIDGCTPAQGSNSQDCGTVSSWIDGDLGGNFSSGADYVWFSSPEYSNEVGYVLIHNDGRVTLNPAWGSIAQSDAYAGGATTSGKIPWLLYRPLEAPEVPLPPAVWLFGSGILGLIAIGRRKVC
jgi:hypothetical protein